jgi:predicted protein tyrosine phosphatase
VKKVLLVRSQNRLRSPTAEHIFSKRPDIEVDSAGTNNDAENPVTAESVEWADIIFVMEKAHRKKLQRRLCPQLKKARVICLDIPDDFEFMDPMLIRILEARVSRYLPWAHMWISLAQGCSGKMNQVANSLQHFLSPVAKQWERVPEGRVRALLSP